MALSDGLLYGLRLRYNNNARLTTLNVEVRTKRKFQPSTGTFLVNYAVNK